MENEKNIKTREELIKEMTADMSIQAGLKPCEMSCEECPSRQFCPTAIDATYAIDAGYRKQSDTAREFVEKLNNVLTEFLHQDREDSCQYYLVNYDVLQDRISALAVEYGVEVEE